MELNTIPSGSTRSTDPLLLMTSDSNFKRYTATIKGIDRDLWLQFTYQVRKDGRTVAEAITCLVELYLAREPKPTEEAHLAR